jgi:glycosyltransferase involved in cell wall biosynthesis
MPGGGFKPHRVVFVSHDSQRMGAPNLLLDVVRAIAGDPAYSASVVLHHGGDLSSEFRAVAPTQTALPEVPAWVPRYDVARGRMASWRVPKAFVDRAVRRHNNANLAYLNTITLGRYARAFAALGVPILTHVHELEYWMRNKIPSDELTEALTLSRRFIAVSEAVRHNLVDNFGVPDEKITVIHGSVSENVPLAEVGDLRADLGIPADAQVVGGVGSLDWRKGPDLFVVLAKLVASKVLVRPVHFVWLGGDPLSRKGRELIHQVRLAGLTGRVHFVAAVSNPAPYFAIFDLFVLPSREDPFPLVVLEAARASVPCVAFELGGGAAEFVRDDAGALAPYLDLTSMANSVFDLLLDDAARHRAGAVAAGRVRAEHNPHVMVSRVRQAIEQTLEHSVPM